MEGPRAPLDQEMPNLFGFLKNQLRPNETWNVDNEYPTAFSHNNRHNIRMISDEGQILAHAVLKPLIIKTPSVIWKVAAIGSVVTSPEHRQMGLSRKIMESCIQEAEAQDCDLALLWTNLYDFYRKWNFELAGQEYAFIIDHPLETNRSDLKIIKGSQISADSLLKLYNQHSVTSLRTTDDIKKYLSIPNSQIFTAWDVNNNLMAYAVTGKGADLQGYIHEWGGNIPCLMFVINQMLKDMQVPLTLIVPNHSQNLIRQLHKSSLLQNEGFLGMIKILKPEIFFAKIKKTARSLGILDIMIEERNGEYWLGCGQDIIVINDIKSLIQIIFGPAQDIPYLNEDTKRKLSKIFPMPLWIWGWDSI